MSATQTTDDLIYGRSMFTSSFARSLRVQFELDDDDVNFAN